MHASGCTPLITFVFSCWMVAKVGNNVKLMGHVYMGERSQVGDGSLVYPQAIIREDVSIGKNCIIHAGVVIGSDGFGYFYQDGKHNKIPQIGKVIIEDDVEIGSCSTIDRATIGATIIKKGVKIDNLVQIAHNVEIGEHSILVAQVGIAGSCQLGPGVVLAGQVGVADHVKIGAGTQVGAQSGIKYDTEPGSTWFGSPAKPLQETLKEFVNLKKLPSLLKDIKKIKEKLGL